MGLSRSNENGLLAGVAGGFAPLNNGLFVPTSYLPFGQAVANPSLFTGDTVRGSSIGSFTDVAAFDVKEVVGNTLHLVTKGAAKDQKVRYTLASSKAGAFDLRLSLVVSGAFWASVNDQFFRVRLTTSADAQIAVALVGFVRTSSSSPQHCIGVFFGGSGAVFTSGVMPMSTLGTPVTLRFTRDGSNVCRYYVGFGAAPVALVQQLDGALAPYTNTVSGTLEQAELALATAASGPTSTSQIEAFIDYVSSV